MVGDGFMRVWMLKGGGAGPAVVGGKGRMDWQRERRKRIRGAKPKKSRIKQRPVEKEGGAGGTPFGQIAAPWRGGTGYWGWKAWQLESLHCTVVKKLCLVGK